MTTQREVIDKTTKLVKREGYTDFEHDGRFDSNTEEILEERFDFDPPIDEENWYWNGTTFTTEQP